MKKVQLGVFAAAALLAGSAQAQSALTPGGVLRGDLSRSDARLDDGSFYDCHVLRTGAGRRYRVEMHSEVFDAYMALGAGSNCVWSDSQSDDDSAGGTDSRIDFTGDGRVWSVRANSLLADETGPYTLTVVELGAGPVAREGAAISFGQSVRGELSAGDLTASDDSLYDCFPFSGRAGQQVSVEMRSSEFDTYLGLYPGAYCAGDPLRTDDDGAGGTDSRVDVTLPRDGVYSIRANSLGSWETGAYRLSLAGGGGGSGPPATAAPSRFAGLREREARVYFRGSHALRSMSGKTDGTESVLIAAGRETPPADLNATEAVGRSWYRDSGSVRVEGREFVKYGLPRVLGFNEVEFYSEYDGVAFAAEAGSTDPEVIYALVRSVGCEFQPYVREG